MNGLSLGEVFVLIHQIIVIVSLPDVLTFLLLHYISIKYKDFSI